MLREFNLRGIVTKMELNKAYKNILGTLPHWHRVYRKVKDNDL